MLIVLKAMGLFDVAHLSAPHWNRLTLSWPMPLHRQVGGGRSLSLGKRKLTKTAMSPEPPMT